MVLAIGEIKSCRRGTRGGKGRKSPAESVNVIGDGCNSDLSDWILESVSSRHLVNDASMMQDVESCDHEVFIVDGKSLKMTKCGSVSLIVIANGKEKSITLTALYLAPQLARNTISYGKL